MISALLPPKLGSPARIGRPDPTDLPKPRPDLNNRMAPAKPRTVDGDAAGTTVRSKRETAT